MAPMIAVTQSVIAEEANFHFIGVFCLVALSGFYIHIFVDTVGAMLRRRFSNKTQPTWLVAATVFLFLALILDVTAVVIRIYQGLRVDPDGQQSSAVSYFMDQSTPLAIIPDICLLGAVLLTDGIMVYRTYVVWGRRVKFAVLPALIWAANIGAEIWVIFGLVSITPNGSVLMLLSEVLTRVTVIVILTFVLNLLCAALITWRLFLFDSSSRNEGITRTTGRLRLAKAAEVVIQSAGVWCASLLALIVAALVHSPLFFVFLDCLMPINTTVFSLIIVRLWRQSMTPTSAVTLDLTEPSFANVQEQPSSHPQEVTIALSFLHDADDAHGASLVSNRGAEEPVAK